MRLQSSEEERTEGGRDMRGRENLSCLGADQQSPATDGKGRWKGHGRVEDDWSSLPKERADGCVQVAKTTSLNGSQGGWSLSLGLSYSWLWSTELIFHLKVQYATLLCQGCLSAEMTHLPIVPEGWRLQSCFINTCFSALLMETNICNT